MAESKSPIICVTCQRSFPGDLKADDAPRYFAQGPLLPRSDDDHDFKDEATTILSYIEAVSYVTRFAPEVEEKHYETILELLLQLSEEAKRRLELVDYAMREKWNRDPGYNAPERKEGGA
jgi:hypothetical protein